MGAIQLFGLRFFGLLVPPNANQTFIAEVVAAAVVRNCKIFASGLTGSARMRNNRPIQLPALSFDLNYSLLAQVWYLGWIIQHATQRFFMNDIAGALRIID